VHHPSIYSSFVAREERVCGSRSIACQHAQVGEGVGWAGKGALKPGIVGAPWIMVKTSQNRSRLLAF